MKNVKRMLIAALAAVLAVAVLVACGKDTPDPLAPFKNGVGKIADAKTIEQSIEVKRGALVTHSSESVWTLAEDGTAYSVAKTEKTLNDLEADSAYSETSTTETVSKSDALGASIKLDSAYFVELTITADSLTATVKDAAIETLLGVEIGRTLTDATLTMNIADGTLASFTIAYSDGSYRVSIRTTFAY